MKNETEHSTEIRADLGDNSPAQIFGAGFNHADGAVKYGGFDVLKDGMDIADAEELFNSACFESENGLREYSPFEFTAKALNDCEDSERAWKLFEEGIAARIQKGWEEAQRRFTFSA